VTAPHYSVGRQRLYGWVAVGVTLVALGGVVLWGRLQLRTQMRSQIIGRDAMILQALAQQEQMAPGPEIEGLDPREPEYQLGALLRIASLTNIIASRLFTPDGTFVDGIPAHVREAELTDEVLNRLRQGAAVARFLPQLPRDQLFLELPEPDRPRRPAMACVEVSVPLLAPEDSSLIGAAQFLIEGLTVQREFALLDRRLNRQSLLVFAAVAVLVTASLGWAFRKLEQTNILLTARTADLQRANQELAEAAKVTAVGAVASHLIHGLRNPVAGLQSFVVARQEEAGAGAGEEWREALAATRRMQGMIQSVIEVLREQEAGPAYSVPVNELVEAVVAQEKPLADQKGVRLALEGGQSDSPLDNRNAGILRLILSNLVQNAIQASPPGGVVTMNATDTGTQLRFHISDQGSGMPESVRSRLFQPVRSTKEGGSGIGLAISRQLATHLGADLRLAATSVHGTSFQLCVPRTGRLT
jgi:signal transduction histidine kinase